MTRPLVEELQEARPCLAPQDAFLDWAHKALCLCRWQLCPPCQTWRFANESSIVQVCFRCNRACRFQESPGITTSSHIIFVKYVLPLAVVQCFPTWLDFPAHLFWKNKLFFHLSIFFRVPSFGYHGKVCSTGGRRPAFGFWASCAVGVVGKDSHESSMCQLIDR